MDSTPLRAQPKVIEMPEAHNLYSEVCRVVNDLGLLMQSSYVWHAGSQCRRGTILFGPHSVNFLIHDPPEGPVFVLQTGPDKNDLRDTTRVEGISSLIRSHISTTLRNAEPRRDNFWDDLARQAGTTMYRREGGREENEYRAAPQQPVRQERTIAGITVDEIDTLRRIIDRAEQRLDGRATPQQPVRQAQRTPTPQARPEVRRVEPTTVAPAPAAKQPKHAPEEEIIDRFKFLELWD